MKSVYLVLICCLTASVSLAQADREPLFTTADGVKIHYDKIGNGPAVVLIHGFIGNGESWKRTALRMMLADSGHTVVTLDLRGNGRSDKPHKASAYENDIEAYDVIALMKHLGLSQYDVIGYSRGSIVAAKLLAIAPAKQVRRAVLGGMGLDFSDPNWIRRRHFYEALARPGSHPDLQPAVDYAVKSGADTTALKYMQQFQPVTLPSELKRIKQPVLVISGDQDEDNGKAADLAKVLPNATLATVPGTHNSTMGTADFARKVVAFLRK
ncbi:alpha/beta fold hydrolase [Fibrella forsythiae]|uniref:Alpha/beta hydrolase n=1 Tax=Fibrella forsythiae TaxID=2817061 RepID=A0ABS3JBQ7_9BACT|nr:alpha/beta hydrolase [Fibrella forsythiae]MBO0947415.1 alpha/beta hydrolase [Fibrella forsythiae]